MGKSWDSVPEESSLIAISDVFSLCGKLHCSHLASICAWLLNQECCKWKVWMAWGLLWMVIAFSQALIRLLLLLLVDVNGFSLSVCSVEILNKLLCHIVPPWLPENVIMLSTSLQLFLELQPIFGCSPSSVTVLNSRSAEISAFCNVVPYLHLGLS